jgi:pyridoxamine 5'-phosphate oxidase
MSTLEHRMDYERGSLDELSVPADPLALFQRWLAAAEASGVREPHAMTLATVDAHHQPSARIVLLRGADARGFAFFTNYESRKGQELAANPRAALLFFWADLEQQIRIEGRVEPQTAAESLAYFHSRPRASQLGAWASAQSSVLRSRAQLEQSLVAVTTRYAGGDVPLPPFWGGYRLVPSRFEFWQGRRSRLHDRLAYVQDAQDSAFRLERLAP